MLFWGRRPPPFSFNQFFNTELHNTALMLAVAGDSSWIQGDAVCLGCGRVTELLGVPVVTSGPHKICTSACREVLDKLCLRYDFMCAKVKELQERLETGNSRAIEGAKKSTTTFGYQDPPSTALQAVSLRHPTHHTQASCQTTPEHKAGDKVFVRDHSSEPWRAGVFLRYTQEQLPLVRVPGMGELVWGHVTADGTVMSQKVSKPMLKTQSRSPKRGIVNSPQNSSSSPKKKFSSSAPSSPKGGNHSPSGKTTESKGRTGKDDKSKEKSPRKLQATDLVEPSELRDMVKTIADLKLKAERLQGENTRLTAQLNTMTSEKAATEAKLDTVTLRQQTIDSMTKVQGKKTEELNEKKQEAALLKAYNGKLQHSLDDLHTLSEATLQREIDADATMGTVVLRLQNLLRHSSTAVETRKMAASLPPKEFRRWLMSFDTHAPYSHSPTSVNNSRGVRQIRTRQYT